MANIQKALKIRVHQAGKVSQHYVMPQEIFTIGKSQENDLTLYGEKYPKKQILFSWRNNATYLHLPAYANGEVKFQNTSLSLHELIQHRILPSHNGAMLMRLFDGKQGYLTIGSDIRIEFTFDGVKAKPYMRPFKGFNWSYVMMKEITKDIYFKFIFIFFLLLNSILIYAYKDIKIEKPKVFDFKKVARYAKIVLTTKNEPIDVNKPLLTKTNEEESTNSNDTEKTSTPRKQRRKKRGGGKKRGNTTVSKGLLGLVTGVGSSNQSSSVLDFLVDKGLTADLNNMLQSGSNLRKGKNQGIDRGEALDQLIGTGDGIGGIDDLLEDFEEVQEVVKLKKRPQVKINKVQSQSGSKEALGNRGIESITSKVNSVQGRILYIYEKYLKRDVNFRGKVTVEFTIAANGKVSKCNVRESTMNNPSLKADFERELISVIRRLKFPKIPKGIAHYVYPFIFQRIE